MVCVLVSWVLGFGLILVSLVVLFDLGLSVCFCARYVRGLCGFGVICGVLTWVCIVSFVCVEFAALVYGYYWVG